MLRKMRGFTLVELIVVIVLLGIISVVLGRILFQTYQTFVVGQSISNADWRGLLAVERIANDIHTLRSPNDISTALATQLVFVNVSGASVTYQLSGTNLLRNSQTLASNVSSLAFSYLDRTGVVTATPSSIRAINISLATASGNITLSFSTQAAIRVWE